MGLIDEPIPGTHVPLFIEGKVIPLKPFSGHEVKFSTDLLLDGSEPHICPLTFRIVGVISGMEHEYFLRALLTTLHLELGSYLAPHSTHGSGSPLLFSCREHVIVSPCFCSSESLSPERSFLPSL